MYLDNYIKYRLFKSRHIVDLESNEITLFQSVHIIRFQIKEKTYAMYFTI